MRISVIIAARNAAVTLGAALDSALGQTLPPEEVIVVDDGSRDGTADVARSFPGVLCLSQPARGVSAARNRGVAAARGDWVAILDADDLWVPWRLARLASLAAGGPCLVGPDAWVWRPPETPDRACERGERVFADLCGQHLRSPSLAALFENAPITHPLLPRAAVLAEPYDEGLVLGEDTELAWRLAAGGLPVVLVAEPLGFYRFVEDQRHGTPGEVLERRAAMLTRALARCGDHPLAGPRIRGSLREVRRAQAYLHLTRAVRERRWPEVRSAAAAWMVGWAVRDGILRVR